MKLNEIIKSKDYKQFEAIEKSDFTPFGEKELKVTEVLEMFKDNKSHPVWVAFLELHSKGYATKFPECYKVVDTGSYITLKIRGKDIRDERATAKAKHGETVYRTEVPLRKYIPEPFDTKVADQIYKDSKVSNSWVGGRPTDKQI